MLSYLLKFICSKIYNSCSLNKLERVDVNNSYNVTLVIMIWNGMVKVPKLISASVWVMLSESNIIMMTKLTIQNCKIHICTFTSSMILKFQHIG